MTHPDAMPDRTVPDAILAKWQGIADLMAELLGTPAGLIRRVAGAGIEVLIASSGAEHAYRPGESHVLAGSRLYCEAAIDGGAELLVQDVRQDARWAGNPDAERGMVSYLGFPIAWPDKRVFGTICVLDRVARTHSTAHRRLVAQFRDTIEDHLAGLARRVDAPASRWQESATLLQAVVDGAADAIFVKDREGRFLLFNQAAARFVGQSPEDVLGREVGELFGQQAAETIRPLELQVMESGETSTVEETMTANGVERTFLATRSPYRNAAGEIVGLIGISRDVTEMKQAEAALRESEARWQFALDGAGDGVWDWNAETGQTFYSHQWKTMLGYSSEEIGNTAAEWTKRVHPEDLPACLKALEHHLQHDTSYFVVEQRLRAKDGSWRWILERGKTVEWGENRKPRRVIGTHTDITARKAVEAELALQRERLTLATEASRLGVWDYNLITDETLCDARWWEIFGAEPGQSALTLENFNRFLHPEDAERVTQERMAALAARRKIHHIDFRIVTPAGEVKWIVSSAQLLAGSEGTPTRLVGLVMDVTESRLAEEKLQRSYDALRQAEKLTKMGSWVWHIAEDRFSWSDALHDMMEWDPFRPLPALQGLAEFLTPAGFQAFLAATETCRTTGAPYSIEVEFVSLSGRHFFADVRGQANRDAAGRVASLVGTIQDISERKETQARLAALADNLPSGAIYRLERAADGRFSLPYVSAGILALTGVDAATIMEDWRAFLRRLHDEDLPRLQAALEQSRLSASLFDCQFRTRTPDGRVLWLHSRSAPRYQTDGRTIWDGVMQDITQERQTAEALMQAKEAAEAAERAKSDFLATMSHEIRTPMNTVLGMTRLALQTDLAPKQRNYLSKVDAAANSLIAIISDVLDFSKIEAGRLELEESEFTLESLLESVSAVTAMKAEEKGLEIAFDVAADVPERLAGDSLRLGQVLINLVNNAVKFTHQGEVVVSVFPVPDTGVGNPVMQFAVRDTGIGLDAAQIAGLFRPFSQGDTQISRRYGGTGLGLAICKHLVERMGGRIWVSSEPGKGSVFSFTTAMKIPQSAPLRAPAMRPAKIAGRRVLVVDDNASTRDIISRMIRDFGMTTQTAASGPVALVMLKEAALRGEAFDLVLMDWQMPGMDGLEAARQIKTDMALQRLPAVLMVTAYGREEVLRRAEQLGLNGVLIKPVTESVMFNTIADILECPRSDARADPTPPLDAGLPAETHELGWLGVLRDRHVLIVDDNALNREVVGDFLLAAGVRIGVATSGREALAQLALTEYDAVLMDMHMPEMDGLTATREIRREPRWAALPIISLTAQARIEDRAASLAAGMNAHLTKPIDEKLLYRTLAQQFVAMRNDAPVAEPDAPPALPVDDSAGLDLAGALALLGGREELLSRVLRGFVEDFVETPAQLAAHVRAGDIAAIAAVAHAVRGAASYFGATTLCQTAERLEDAFRQGDLTGAEQEIPALRHGLEMALGQLNQLLASAPHAANG